METATTLQSCVNILGGLGAVNDLLIDKETLATLVQGLPLLARDRWYQRDKPDGETIQQRNQAFLLWMEREEEGCAISP